jgi:glutathione S-transferase
VNANGTVPSLVHEKSKKVLDDSTDICEFLNKEYEGINLLPEEHTAEVRQLIQEAHAVDANFLTASAANEAELQQKKAFVTGFLEARVQSLQNYQKSTEEHKEYYLGKLQQNEFLLGAFSHPEKAGPLYAKHEAEWQNAIVFLNKLNDRLKKKENKGYLVGNQFTLADIHVIPLVIRLKTVKGDAVLDGRSDLADYLTSVSSRPSVQSVFQV